MGNTKDDVGFNIQTVKQLRVTDTNSLREQVKEQVAKFYGLSEKGGA